MTPLTAAVSQKIDALFPPESREAAGRMLAEQCGANLPALLLALAFALQANASELVISTAGNLPILLTVPHGGLQPVPNVPPRTRGITSTDGYTIELAQAVSKHLEASLGARPYLVAARFTRKHIDANRAPADAYESPRAKAAYDAYHGEIRRFIGEIKEKYPQGALLLDIHGQSDDPAVLHRGTQNGATVAALLRRHGPDALTGPKSIFGVIPGKGIKVFPPNGPVGFPPEDKRFSGGYTVQTYGSRSAEGLDAIQLEPGRDLRKDPRFAAALGEAIATFHRAYLQ
jgi:N-formylglutamate amidohydrolase